jgi:YbgC/YbaW family acyl-CoA thioester hydrolase
VAVKPGSDGGESLRDIEVQWGDLDSLGIVFYPRFFAWADEAAHQLFRAAGLPMDRLLRERKISFGLVSSSAEFRSPARYGERLTSRCAVAKLGTRSVELLHRLVRHADGVDVATIRETRVCMDVSEPGAIRAMQLPADVAAALRRFEITANQAVQG